MLESPISSCALPGQASSSLPPPTYSIKEAVKLPSPSSTSLLPSFRRCGNPSRGGGEPSVPAIDSCGLARRARPSIRVNDPGSGRVPSSGRVSAVDSRRPPPPPLPIDDPVLGRHPLRVIDPCRPASRPQPSTRVDDSGLARLPLRVIDPCRPASRPRPWTGVDDPGSGRFRAIDSRPSVPRLRPSIRVQDPGSGRVSAIDSPRPTPPHRPVDDPAPGPLPLPAIGSRPAPGPRPSIRVNHPGSGRVGAINSLRPSIRVEDAGPGRVRAINPRRRASRPQPFTVPSAAVANKELEEAENGIQRLNKLGLGDDISYEEYLGYLKQLPDKPDVDTSIELDAVQLKELNIRHALYRVKYYQSQQVPEDKLCYDKLEVDYPPSRLDEERFHKGYEEDGKLDWSFHPDYCKLAGLEDYQWLVPRNYGGYEYVGWDEYRKDFHSYEIEQEYIKYCEDLSNKLKWMEAYVPNKSPSLKWGRILTRGTYQAIKIATDFSKITGRLAFLGFYEWLDSMSFDVCSYNELDGVYYEIWQRYTNETKFRDVLDEVYELNRFPLRQDRMRCALENDTFCSDFEQEFLACTTCLKEFTEDKAQVTEEKARKLIAEALRNETQKPKFYEEYCRKKINIARAIGLISS